MDYKKEYERWLASPCLSEEERAELQSVAGDETEIESRFYAPLSFGTAGLRGVLGIGVNRMNRFTVGQATQGLANLILQNGEQTAAKGVAIAFDCRIMSPEFAQYAACILAGNGIPVYLFDALRPTPELSFAVRHYGCIAGINITASHNPKEYNGYKVYWEDGAQLPPKEADVVAKEMEEIDIFTGVKAGDYGELVKSGKIRILSGETDEAYLQEVLKMAVNPDCVKAVADTFKLVYTPFHGAGYKLVPEALRRLGYQHILCVPEQMVIDGTFPTVASPNPENKEGFVYAIELAKQHNVDLIIGTDPDSDRVGIVLKDSEGEYVTLSGNQVGVLLIDYLITAKKLTNTMPERPAVLKTIVTTEMARKVCQENGVACFDTFTGFKFMAEKIKQFEAENSYRYIFAYEESYGYLCGDYARDKDAVTASMLIAEMAAYYKTKNMTLYDAMQKLYEKYGWYGEKTINVVMPGIAGLQNMAKLMDRLNAEPLTEIGGEKVNRIRYYKTGEILDLATGEKSKMELSGSNVLYYELADGTNFIIRPSGTEPKVKVYILAQGDDAAHIQVKIQRYEQAAHEIVK